ncbi:MAG: DUF2726 domain-containing protein [Planctomycetota bacterium]|nr:DUF2726 domain-containing protein [Planctomycetota bacterium]
MHSSNDRRRRRQRIDRVLKEWAERAPEAPLPYERAPHLLSSGERALWYPLYRAVQGKYRIFCKVRLADVVRCPAANREEQRWFRKIGRFHVDFVLCEPQTTAPLLVIELDDQSHHSKQRRARDRFKDAVLGAARVPIYRVRAQQAYDPLELAATVGRLIPAST